MEVATAHLFWLLAHKPESPTTPPVTLSLSQLLCGWP